MKRIFRLLIIALLWLGIWEIAYLLVGMDVLFPSPAATFIKLFQLFGNLDFWLSVSLSMGRILLGFLSGLLIGIVLAALTSLSTLIYDFFKPLISIIKATPVASFIVLALVWMNSGAVPVFTAFLIVLPIVWANVVEGIKNTDNSLLEMAKAFAMPMGSKIKKIYIPSVFPYFSAAATTSLGMAWKAGIAAEVIATPVYSIGKGIYNSKIYLDTTELFAWTVAIIALSIILEKSMLYLLHRRVVD